MKILLDATAIPPSLAGVGRYVDEIAPALINEGVDMTVVCQESYSQRARTYAGNEKVIALGKEYEPRSRRMRWEQMELPRLISSLDVDLLLSPHYTMPHKRLKNLRGEQIPTVVTLHDATFFTMPEVHTWLKRYFFRYATKYATRRAAHLIVPSRATRDEVIRFTQASESQFTVAYHGVDHKRFHSVTDEQKQRVAQSLGLGDSAYIAFLGLIEPRKNVPALIRAWVQACSDMPQPPALVLAGSKGWDTTVEAEMEKVPPHLRVLAPGYLPLEDLPGFLAGAHIVAYPSLGEGFGLPVLEAMACGAAVLTTRKLSLPEVGGDAVEYCGTDVPDIAQGIRTLLSDEQRRIELGALGMERAQGFTWKAAAGQHLEAFRAALGNGKN